MPDESERDRLAARAYSRAAEAEPVESFIDLDTGETVRMRRSAMRRSQPWCSPQ
jgi:hypothetical protein